MFVYCTEVLLGRATHKSKRQIEVLVADLAPRPDVPTSIRKLPDRSAGTSATPAMTASNDGRQLGPDRVLVTRSDPSLDQGQRGTPSATPAVDNSRIGAGTHSGRAAVEPLGAARYKSHASDDGRVASSAPADDAAAHTAGWSSITSCLGPAAGIGHPATSA